MKSSVETITPQVAEQMLAANTSNRRVRGKTSVRAIADDIRAGRWVMNGEAIIIADTGRLLDGQHRLLAVIEAGIPIRTFVTRGVPEAAFATIDSNGAARSTADVLEMDGVLYATHAAAVARIVIGYKGHGRLNPHGLSKTEVRAFVLSHANDMLPWIAKAHPSPVTSASILAAVCYLASEGGYLQAGAQDFLNGVVEGADLPIGDPRLTLRNLIINSKSRSGAHISRPFEFNATATAWNAFAQGRELRVLRAKQSPLVEVIGSRNAKAESTVTPLRAA